MTLAKKFYEAVILAIIWGAVAGLALVFVAQLDNQRIGYTLTGLAVLAAWVLTEITLTALKVDTSYSPE